MQPILLIIWLILGLWVLFVPLRDIHNAEAHMVFIYLMIGLTFPVGYLLVTAISLIGYGLDHYFKILLPNSDKMLLPLWFLFMALGYFQWFILIPKLVNRILS